MTSALNDHELAAHIAREAGQLLVRRRAEGATKNDGDRESNDLILARLADARPDDAVLSEESKDDPIRLRRERVWIVDPLDGTREFGEPGRSDWAVHVALVVHGIPHACAVALPAQDDVVFATEPMPTLAPPVAGKLRLLVSRTRPPKLAEYLAAGVPVVAAKVGALPARLHDGVDSVLVTPGDTPALRAALVRLRDDPGERARLGRAGRAAAVDRWSWDRSVRIVLEHLAARGLTKPVPE